MLVSGLPPIRAKKLRHYEDANFTQRLLSHYSSRLPRRCASTGRIHNEILSCGGLKKSPFPGEISYTLTGGRSVGVSHPPLIPPNRCIVSNPVGAQCAPEQADTGMTAALSRSASVEFDVPVEADAWVERLFAAIQAPRPDHGYLPLANQAVAPVRAIRAC